MRYVSTGARIFLLLLAPLFVFGDPAFAQDHSPLMGACSPRITTASCT